MGDCEKVERDIRESENILVTVSYVQMDSNYHKYSSHDANQHLTWLYWWKLIEIGLWEDVSVQLKDSDWIQDTIHVHSLWFM